MSEKSIICYAGEVRGILAGRQTQTRRVVTSRNSSVLGYPGSRVWGHLHHWNKARVDHGPDPFGDGRQYEYLHVPAWNPKDGPVPENEREWMWYRVRPRIVSGDILWVKETWKPYNHVGSIHHRAENGVIYRADGARRETEHNAWTFKQAGKWRPSMLMPKWASRIKLKVLKVRCEPVQKISEEDAKAEGVSPENAECNCPGGAYRNAYCEFWDRLNAKRGYPWDSNPWVWVYEFEKGE